MLTVQVIKKVTGKPVGHCRVTLSFDSLFRGVVSEAADDMGEAHFQADNGAGSVIIDGRTVHKGHLSGRVVVYT